LIQIIAGNPIQEIRLFEVNRGSETSCPKTRQGMRMKAMIVRRVNLLCDIMSNVHLQQSGIRQ
ncbi:MAG: hypothetical protein ACXU93_10000, partial [Thermodesulfobacteriota bacterium]